VEERSEAKDLHALSGRCANAGRADRHQCAYTKEVARGRILRKKNRKGSTASPKKPLPLGVGRKSRRGTPTGGVVRTECSSLTLQGKIGKGKALVPAPDILVSHAKTTLERCSLCKLEEEERSKKELKQAFVKSGWRGPTMAGKGSKGEKSRAHALERNRGWEEGRRRH